jgi:hypothetical protein
LTIEGIRGTICEGMKIGMKTGANAKSALTLFVHI